MGLQGRRRVRRTLSSHEAAVAAAKRAAAEQELPSTTETIEYEDDKGVWHVELDPGDDRPDTEVEDKEE